MIARMHYLTPSLLLLSTVALQAQEPSGPKQELRLQLKPGAPVWFKIHSDSVQSMDMGAQKMNMNSDLHWVLTAAVTKAPADGPATLEFTIADVRGKLSLPMLGDVQVDEQGEGEAAALRALVGGKFTGEITTTGKLKLTGEPGKLVEDALAQAEGMGGQMLAGMINEQTLHQLAESAFVQLPEQPVAVGETWQRTEDKQGGAPVKVNVTMKLVSHAADRSELTATGKVEMAPADEGKGGEDEDPRQAMARQMMQNMKIKDSKLGGKITWSPKDGMVLSSTRDMTIAMSMPGPMGGDMSVVQTQKVQVERTTEAAAKAKPAADKGGEKK